jgi:outer membrane protein OmpA-like peptidoglycan-associated protein
MRFRIALRGCFFLCGLFISHGLPETTTEGLGGVVRTISAKPFERFKLDLSAGANLAQAGDFVEGPTKGTFIFSKIVDTAQILSDAVLQDPAKVFSSNFSLGMGLTNFWDIAMALPLYYDWAGFQGVREGGLGDLQISTRFLLPPISLKKLFYQSIIVSVSVPTGTRNLGLFPRVSSYVKDDTAWNPATDFYSDGAICIKPMAAFTFDIGGVNPKAPLRLHVNAGALISKADEQKALVVAAAIEWWPAEFITLFTEISGEPRWKNISSLTNLQKDPLRLTPGIRITTPSGMYLSLSGDLSLSSTRREDRLNWKKKGFAFSTGIIPQYGVQLTFGWNGFVTVLDDDKDGIPNSMDKCPNDPEDFDGFEDSDGCPDPDNERDGICDPWVAAQGRQSLYAAQCKGSDSCPNIPEDLDGFKDEDGCPDPDNDGDGMLDQKDPCPNSAEDFDGFQDDDGCPDIDNDRDGVPDSLDKCPNAPEDIDGFQDSDGCQDPDNDKDGIPDLKDKCPDQPETVNGTMDDDGCPDTVPVEQKKSPDFPSQQILRGLDFERGKADILFESNYILDRLAKSLREFPGLEIEIRGYTDAIGKVNASIQLSQRRAEAVKRYLINQGIDPLRIRAMGFGPSNPIGDNRTAAGRAVNRRIEVIRTK